MKCLVVASRFATLAFGWLLQGAPTALAAGDSTGRSECGSAIDLSSDDNEVFGAEVFFKPIHQIDGFSRLYLLGVEKDALAYLDNVKAHKNRPFNVCVSSSEAVQGDVANGRVPIWNVTAITDLE